jgi:hypothetical protein
MQAKTSLSGWKRVTPALDVEVQHGVPVHVYCNDTVRPYDDHQIVDRVHELTGLTVSVHEAINLSTKESEWSVCVNKSEFEEVLHRLALASAAMFVDRFHKPIDDSAVDWNEAEFTYDFNHAVEHCCIPWDALNKRRYFERYKHVMEREVLRLVNTGISPLVEAE